MLMEFPSTCHLLLMQGSFLLAPPTRFFLNAAPIRVSNKKLPKRDKPAKTSAGPCQSPQWETSVSARGNNTNCADSWLAQLGCFPFG